MLRLNLIFTFKKRIEEFMIERIVTLVVPYFGLTQEQKDCVAQQLHSLAWEVFPDLKQAFLHPFNAESEDKIVSLVATDFEKCRQACDLPEDYSAALFGLSISPVVIGGSSS